MIKTIAIGLREMHRAGRRSSQHYLPPRSLLSWWRTAVFLLGFRPQKGAQICTIFETAFLLRVASAGGAWVVCTKCTKRGRFSAQARRGSKRALGGREGVGIPRQKPPAGRALSRCIRRAGRQKPARMALVRRGNDACGFKGG